jgi:hypothetical protein
VGVARVATWRDVQDFIKTKLKTLPDPPPGTLGLWFNLPDGRKHRVFLQHEHSKAVGDVVHIISPIGELSKEKVLKACELMAVIGVGGIVQMGRLTTIRHTVLIENLDENELMDPLSFVMVHADLLEQKLTGSDRL